ncbi:MAG: hypothetical protein WBV06_02530, partial [Acidimicrobiia bacterium]
DSTPKRRGVHPVGIAHFDGGVCDESRAGDHVWLQMSKRGQHRVIVVELGDVVPRVRLGDD